MFLVDESRVQAVNDSTIGESEVLKDQVSMIDASLDFLDALRLQQIHRNDDELELLRLGIRCFNTAAAGVKLARCGYYQPGFAMVRDLMELEFLFDFFSREKGAITEWRVLPNSRRKAKFQQAKIRTTLDELDGFKDRKRERAYSQLSSYATHPTPEGAKIISPNNLTQIGPFPDAARLQAVIEEIVRHLPATVLNLCNCFDELNPGAEIARENFKSSLANWRERYNPRLA